MIVLADQECLKCGWTAEAVPHIYGAIVITSDGKHQTGEVHPTMVAAHRAIWKAQKAHRFTNHQSNALEV